MRETYELTQQRRHYYRNQFRKMVRWLTLSLILSAALLTWSAYLYLRWPSKSYFASNAAYAGFVVELKTRDEPNASSTALLKPDLPPEIQLKELNLPASSPAGTQAL